MLWWDAFTITGEIRALQPQTVHIGTLMFVKLHRGICETIPLTVILDIHNLG